MVRGAYAVEAFQRKIESGANLVGEKFASVDSLGKGNPLPTSSFVKCAIRPAYIEF